MANTKPLSSPPNKPAHFVKFFGETVLKAAEASPVLSENWSLLRYVMAYNVCDLLGFPEHPIIPLTRQALNDAFGERRFNLPEGSEELFLAGSIADNLRNSFPELRVMCEREELLAWIRSITYTQLAARTADATLRQAFIERAKAIELKMDESFVHSAPDEMAQIGFRLANLRRDLDPARPTGRPKGLPKPKNSGKAPIDKEIALAAYKAKQAAPEYQSPPWWQRFGKQKGLIVPSEPKAREAFRKKMESWAITGARLARKHSR